MDHIVHSNNNTHCLPEFMSTITLNGCSKRRKPKISQEWKLRKGEYELVQDDDDSDEDDMAQTAMSQTQQHVETQFVKVPNDAKEPVLKRFDELCNNLRRQRELATSQAPLYLAMFVTNAEQCVSDGFLDDYALDLQNAAIFDEVQKEIDTIETQIQFMPSSGIPSIQAGAEIFRLPKFQNSSTTGLWAGYM